MEIKPSSKTKIEIAEGGLLKETTPSCTCEPVPEVETDVSNSGSVGDSWLVMLSMIN